MAKIIPLIANHALLDFIASKDLLHQVHVLQVLSPQQLKPMTYRTANLVQKVLTVCVELLIPCLALEELTDRRSMDQRKEIVKIVLLEHSASLVLKLLHCVRMEPCHP